MMEDLQIVLPLLMICVGVILGAWMGAKGGFSASIVLSIIVGIAGFIVGAIMVLILRYIDNPVVVILSLVTLSLLVYSMRIIILEGNKD